MQCLFFGLTCTNESYTVKFGSCIRSILIFLKHMPQLPVYIALCSEEQPELVLSVNRVQIGSITLAIKAQIPFHVERNVWYVRFELSDIDIEWSSFTKHINTKANYSGISITVCIVFFFIYRMLVRPVHGLISFSFSLQTLEFKFFNKAFNLRFYFFIIHFLLIWCVCVENKGFSTHSQSLLKTCNGVFKTCKIHIK